MCRDSSATVPLDEYVDVDIDPLLQNLCICGQRTLIEQPGPDATASPALCVAFLRGSIFELDTGERLQQGLYRGKHPVNVRHSYPTPRAYVGKRMLGVSAANVNE